ncbi:hypothetical protein CC78DRAFT_619677 [Lojkania enalia]|uniref:Protein BIG1 n=1 Tax=Lojkania enalia TaxID=147567 RepID=A0A9P4K470_9PLEO|nr:hypothetical protein CC78DRAFT_619677 [Didymosphaeria enalia]
MKSSTYLTLASAALPFAAGATLLVVPQVTATPRTTALCLYPKRAYPASPQFSSVTAYRLDNSIVGLSAEATSLLQEKYEAFVGPRILEKEEKGKEKQRSDDKGIGEHGGSKLDYTNQSDYSSRPKEGKLGPRDHKWLEEYGSSKLDYNLAIEKRRGDKKPLEEHGGEKLDYGGQVVREPWSHKPTEEHGGEELDSSDESNDESGAEDGKLARHSDPKVQVMDAQIHLRSQDTSLKDVITVFAELATSGVIIVTLAMIAIYWLQPRVHKTVEKDQDVEKDEERNLMHKEEDAEKREG